MEEKRNSNYKVSLILKGKPDYKSKQGKRVEDSPKGKRLYILIKLHTSLCRCKNEECKNWKKNHGRIGEDMIGRRNSFRTSNNFCTLVSYLIPNVEAQAMAR